VVLLGHPPACTRPFQRHCQATNNVRT
jgi:hypothetical protein